MFYGNYDIFVINLKQKEYITHDSLYLCTETNKVFFFGYHHRHWLCKLFLMVRTLENEKETIFTDGVRYSWHT